MPNGAFITTVSDALKLDYQDMVREQLNQENYLLSIVDQNEKDVNGLYAVLALHLGRSSGVGARPEGATLPTASNQKYKQENVPLSYNYGHIVLSGPLMKAMSSDTGSFVRALDSEVKGIVNDLKRTVNRELFGTSNGVLAQCGTTTASTTVNLNSSTPSNIWQYLGDDILIDIGTVGSPTSIASGLSISSVNEGSNDIVVSSAVTTSSADFIFVSGAGGVGIELTGLQSIVSSSGTLFNVDPSVYPIWASYEADSVGTISDQVFQSAMNATKKKGGEDISTIITTYGVQEAYSATLASNKRYSNTIELAGGFSAVTINAGRGNVTLYPDRDCTDGFAYGLNSSHLFEHQSSDWEFMDQDGATLARIPGTDSYEATLFKYHQLTTDKRNSHFVLKGITES